MGISASGTELRAAAARAAIWGTAVQCGAADGVLVLPSEIKKTREALAEDSLGTLFSNSSDAGAVKVEGELKAYLRYDGLDLLLALAMGATGGAPVRQGTSAAYGQTLKLNGSLDGLFATLAINNGVNVDEFASVKLSGFQIKGEAGKPVEATFSLIANDRTTGSTVNTTATFSAVTDFETSNRTLFSQAVFRCNARFGAALADTDRIYPSAFTLKFVRKLLGVRTLGSGADTVDEPSNDGLPDCTLSLTFPRYTGATHFADWDAAAPKKLDLAFTGAVIEGSYRRALRFSFPNLAYKGVELPIRRGLLEHPVEFICLGTELASSGMDGIMEPFGLELVNRQSADVLG